MTTEARKRVLRYAIAADLVILVTGIGLLFSGLSGDATVVLYLAAVAVAAWKGGGWIGGIVAMLLSLVAAEVVFGTMDARHAAVFAGASLVLAAAARVARPRARVALPTDSTTLAPVLTFERNGETEIRPGAEAERLAREVEGRVAAEREAARVAAEKKLAGEQKLAAEKKAAAEREGARVAAEKKLAEERKLAAEKKAAAEREAARVAAEKKLAEEQRLAAEKKAAAEREAARITAEKKVAAEKKLTGDKKLAGTRQTAPRERGERAPRAREAARPPG